MRIAVAALIRTTVCLIAGLHRVQSAAAGERAVGVLLSLGWMLWGCQRQAAIGPNEPASAQADSKNAPVRPTELEAQEQKINQTIWAKEMLAQKCGRVIETLWDQLNGASNQLSIVATFPVGQVRLGDWSKVEQLPHGIVTRSAGGSGPVLSPTEWRQFIQNSARAGWGLMQTEFRQQSFDTDDAGQPRQSRFYFSAHLTNAVHTERVILEGDLFLDWSPGIGAAGLAVQTVDASHLTIKNRVGDPPFQPELVEEIGSPQDDAWIGALILYDLDGDGLSEIVLPSKNLVYRRQLDGKYRSEPLCRAPPSVIFGAVLADFDGDGRADLLCTTPKGVMLWKGSAQGTFEELGQLVWRPKRDWVRPMALTCGDIDGDGDLDVFVGQYKLPYVGGQMPTPFYDANDGEPAYLLVNDGRGRFSDATTAAGLESKRWRRSFGASLVDLDGDGHLDLMVVSDFAGLDLYQNNGHGQFTDRTAQWVQESHAFGMAHALADFNADGRLDLLMMGMPSPTADRLEHANLGRPSSSQDPAMRAKMAFGNRLYLGREGGGFEPAAANASIARSGWSWGCSAFDFDNDGFPDVAIGNGMESRDSVREYDPEFWLHDIYVANSTNNPAVAAYFGAKITQLRSEGASYGGYEKNRFFLNQDGNAFVEVAHLLGVALELDSRNVVSDDLDGDGRVDLLVTSFDRWPRPKRMLRIYRNVLSPSGNWIGFRLHEAPGASAVGARVTIQYSGRRAVRQIVTGDSFRSQHASTLHFGLGAADQVQKVRVEWKNGRVANLEQLAVNRYYNVGPPEQVDQP